MSDLRVIGIPLANLSGEWPFIAPASGLAACLFAAGACLVVDALGGFRRRWHFRVVFLSIVTCLFWFFLQFLGTMSA